MTRWQRYIKKRLNRLVYKTHFSNPKSRQNINPFLKFYWRTAIKIIKDQRLAQIIVDDPKLWSRVNPAHRWWAIFRFLPFVNTIVLRIQEELKEREPFYAAKLEGKTLYDYFLHNISANQPFNQGVLEEDVVGAELSNQALVDALIFERTRIELYYLITDFPAGWNKEIRRLVLKDQNNLLKIEGILSVEDAKILLNEFRFLKNNLILNNIIKKTARRVQEPVVEKFAPSLSESSNQQPSKDPGAPAEILSSHEEVSEVESESSKGYTFS